MPLMSRIEAETRLRQQMLLEEAKREQMAEAGKPAVVRVTGAPVVHSQFFARRFGGILNRLKLQPA